MMTTIMIHETFINYDDGDDGDDGDDDDDDDSTLTPMGDLDFGHWPHRLS